MNNYTTNTKLIKSVYYYTFYYCLHHSWHQPAIIQSLNTPDGFTVELFATDINAPRQMAEG